MAPEMMYDIAIIGAGPAGLTAALFGARYGYLTVVVEREMAGVQIINAERVENYPGFPEGTSGFELAPLMQEHVMESGAEFLSAEVTSVHPGELYHRLTTSEGELSARAVIIANGSTLRSLGIPGEEELRGKGVSHCATCDGPFFQDQVVGVVGDGDSAMDEAQTLSQYASKVLLFSRTDTLHAQKVLQDRILTNPKVEVRWNTVVEKITGEGKVSGVHLRDVTTLKCHRVGLSALFVYVGLEPNSIYLSGALQLDNGGHIPTDIWMATGLPGIFAAGDIRQSSAAQVVTAAGDGATASIAAHRYISGRDWPDG